LATTVVLTWQAVGKAIVGMLCISGAMCDACAAIINKIDKVCSLLLFYRDSPVTVKRRRLRNRRMGVKNEGSYCL